MCKVLQNINCYELTAFDLLDNIKHFGINRIATILTELYEVMLPYNAL